MQRTAAAAEAELATVADRFYAGLFAARPDLRSMFSDDLAAQREKFAAELAALVQVVSDFDRFVARTSELGARHREYGVRAAHYEPAGVALLDALASVLGDGWDEDTAAAWRSAYRLTTEAMQRGAHLQV